MPSSASARMHHGTLLAESTRQNHARDQTTCPISLCMPAPHGIPLQNHEERIMPDQRLHACIAGVRTLHIRQERSSSGRRGAEARLHACATGTIRHPQDCVGMSDSPLNDRVQVSSAHLLPWHGVLGECAKPVPVVPACHSSAEPRGS